MITAVISVYKVANFPDGGGHFWVYMQYVQGLLRLGCEVYWLEQFQPAPDPEREAHLLASFFERMKRFGLEGKTLLYAVDRNQEGGTASFRFVGRTWSEAEAVLRRADLLLNFHYAIEPRLLASVSAHGARGHRPGTASTLDEHRRARRGRTRPLLDHWRNRGDIGGPFL